MLVTSKVHTDATASWYVLPNYVVHHLSQDCRLHAVRTPHPHWPPPKPVNPLLATRWGKGGAIGRAALSWDGSRLAPDRFREGLGERERLPAGWGSGSVFPGRAGRALFRFFESSARSTGEHV